MRDKMSKCDYVYTTPSSIDGQHVLFLKILFGQKGILSNEEHALIKYACAQVVEAIKVVCLEVLSTPL